MTTITQVITRTGFDDNPLDSLLKRLDRREYIDGIIQNDGTGDQTRGRVLKFGEEYFDYHLRITS